MGVGGGGGVDGRDEPKLQFFRFRAQFRIRLLVGPRIVIMVGQTRFPAACGFRLGIGPKLFVSFNSQYYIDETKNETKLA